MLVLTKMKSWLYTRSVNNLVNRAIIGEPLFLLNNLFLRFVTGFFHTGKIIQRSAALEAIRQRDWDKLKNDRRYELYKPLFSKIHFFKDEVWQIKGCIYRIEAVNNICEVDLINIETYESTTLEQLMPLDIEDIKYLHNLSYELTKMNIYLKGNYQVMTYEQFALD